RGSPVADALLSLGRPVLRELAVLGIGGRRAPLVEVGHGDRRGVGVGEVDVLDVGRRRREARGAPARPAPALAGGARDGLLADDLAAGQHATLALAGVAA